MCSYAGIATHYIPSKKINEFLDRIRQNEDPVKVVNDLHSPVQLAENSVLIKQKHIIDNCFSKPTAEEIFIALKLTQDQFASSTLSTLQKMSPLTLKVVLRGYKENAQKSIEECLKFEGDISFQLVKEDDFYEGVRALLVDKDRYPKWNPRDIFSVTAQHVDALFKAIELLLKN